MKAYKVSKETTKIEAMNCLVIVTDNLSDRKGRPVTSVQIIPDKYAGERKNVRVGGCANIRVITLKKKNK